MLFISLSVAQRFHANPLNSCGFYNYRADPTRFFLPAVQIQKLMPKKNNKNYIPFDLHANRPSPILSQLSSVNAIAYSKKDIYFKLCNVVSQQCVLCQSKWGVLMYSMWDSLWSLFILSWFLHSIHIRNNQQSLYKVCISPHAYRPTSFRTEFVQLYLQGVRQIKLLSFNMATFLNLSFC